MINYKISYSDLRSSFGLYNIKYNFNGFSIIRSELNNPFNREIRISRYNTLLGSKSYIGIKLAKKYK